MSTAAQRMRRHRERVKANKRVFAVEAGPDEISALIASGHLRPSDAEDDARIREAICRAIFSVTRHGR